MKKSELIHLCSFGIGAFVAGYAYWVSPDGQWWVYALVGFVVYAIVYYKWLKSAARNKIARLTVARMEDVVDGKQQGQASGRWKDYRQGWF